MNRDKCFFFLHMYFFTILKKTEAIIDWFLKFMMNKFHQKDHVEIGLNDSEVILVWKTKNIQDS